jgi:membrane dipeptidase
MARMPIIDGHLDIAMNALLHERDQTLPLAQVHQREAHGVADDRGQAMVTLPALREAGVAMVVATLIARCKPGIDARRPIGRADLDYPDPAMAHAAAQGQLAYYRHLERRGEIELITDVSQLDHAMARAQQPSSEGGGHAPLAVLLMMEGADPITEPEEHALWHELGVRCLSLAHFGRSRYAAGTPSSDPNSPEKDGPLTDRGLALLEAMAEKPVALDLTHLGDTSFAQAIERFEGPVCATHANCRALADTPRQLTDRQLKHIVQRGGVIGVALHAGMIRCAHGHEAIKPGDIALRHLADHIDHICQLAGSADHVALGSDLDGGFGAERTPSDVTEYQDLHSLAPLLEKRGFSEADRANFFYGNWWRFYRAVLSGEQ